MNILHLSTHDYDAGASRAAYRLHRGLLAAGVSSRMLVGTKFGTDYTVIGPSSKIGKGVSILRPELDSLPLQLYRKRLPGTWTTGWLPNSTESQCSHLPHDLIHLHWVGFGFMPITAIPRLKRPVVWTFHDMWPFTGGCHYAGDCTCYREQCGNCPQLSSSAAWDLSRWILKRKLRLWDHLDLTIATPSHWLASCVRASRLFAGARIEVIPNGLDTSLFKPTEKTQARMLLNLPQDKRLILVGAINISAEPRKGLHLLQTALSTLVDKGLGNELELLVVGCGEPEKVGDNKLKTHYLGRWHDDISLALLYSAADVFVAPSIQDNLPNTVMEALACGTPCVAFDIGGMPDMINHCQNGYLATPFDPDDLASGIQWVLQDRQRYTTLAQEARQKVASNFSLENIARQHLELYKDILSNSRAK